MAEKTKTELLLEAPGLDLEATLFCGQSFSWAEAQPGVYTGVAGGRAVTASMQGSKLLLRGAGETPLGEADAAFWRHYFALDADYPALHARFAKDAQLAACVADFAGLRVLRQPFFDTLLSFILSQNNNIPRITAIAGRLRRDFGQCLAPGVYAFPRADELAGCTAEQLAGLRAGFRARYLVDAAQKVASGEVGEEQLRALPTRQARVLLQSIVGVGPKVADCVLLYALQRDEVAPMDVWMRRAMEQIFPAGMPEGARGAEGIAQQYIFCWARQNLQAGS